MAEITDEELKQLEAELQSMEEGDDTSSLPTPDKKDSTLVLFRELISSKDSRKFGNLNNVELGTPTHSVRKELEVANYLEAEGIPTLARYFENRAELTLATSLSKKGKLIDNIVTQIKKEQKVKDSPESKKGFLGFGKSKEGGSE
jgi:hypothetical protein